jgi:hypothetical protein
MVRDFLTPAWLRSYSACSIWIVLGGRQKVSAQGSLQWRPLVNGNLSFLKR